VVVCCEQDTAMNIFATSTCPVASARYLDDARLVKMILESCQMLSTTAHALGRRPDNWPKPTHAHHPCNLWLLRGRGNVEWLVEHVYALDAERRIRRPGVAPHVTLATLTRGRDLAHVVRAVSPGTTPHANCARRKSLGLDFTWVTDTFYAYRLYLHARWAIQCAPSASRQKSVVATVTNCYN
jgi:hypothetical protein